MTLSDDPACNEIVELVTEFVEDVLSAADRARFEQHLVLCEPCAIYVDQFRRTIALTGRTGAEELTSEAREGFVTLLRAWKSGRVGQDPDPAANRGRGPADENDGPAPAE